MSDADNTEAQAKPEPSEAELLAQDILRSLRIKYLGVLEGGMRQLATSMNASALEGAAAGLSVAAYGIYYAPEKPEDRPAFIQAAHVLLDRCFATMEQHVAAGLLLTPEQMQAEQQKMALHSSGPVDPSRLN